MHDLTDVKCPADQMFNTPKMTCHCSLQADVQGKKQEVLFQGWWRTLAGGGMICGVLPDEVFGILWRIHSNELWESI